MIKLDPPVLDESTKQIITDGAKSVIESLSGRVEYKAFLCVLCPCGVLDESLLEKLLFGDLLELKNLAGRIGAITGVRNDDPFVKEYKKLYGGQPKSLLSTVVKTKTCPFCNRNYIFSYSRGKARYMYDHFFPKSRYPYLAISPHNLIPICWHCNVAKGSFDALNGNNHLLMYPYEDEYGDTIYFDFKYKSFDSLIRNQDKLEITINTDHAELTLKRRAEQTIERLHILKYYQQHADFAVDIFRNVYIANSNYGKSLRKTFPLLFMSDEETLLASALAVPSKAKWKDRTMSKFTYDIIRRFLNGQ